MSERNDGFQVVADLSQIPDPGKITLEVNGRVVVLVRSDGDVYCIDDVCTHDGGTLGDGELEDHCLVCPRHGAKFDVRTGNAVTMPATEPTQTFDVLVEGDQVLVRVSSE